MDPEKIMTGISKELLVSLKAMAKATTLEDKQKYSEIVKNLCDSLGVFLGVITNMTAYDYDDDDGPIPF